MLRRIKIENYALIESLEMEIDEHLNIITGETGAGKSILLGALGLLLGNKNDGAAIKDNTKSCVIEAIFSIEALSLKPLFEEFDWDWQAETIVRRVISPSGKSRAFINDLPVQLSELKELSSYLIDIHSQHQNRVLSSESFRIGALDALAANSSLLDSYRTSYAALGVARKTLTEAQESLAAARREQEWLSFQVEELSAAQLKAGEDIEAEAELLILENVDKISESLSLFEQRVDDEDYGVLHSLRSSQSDFESLGATFAPAAEYAKRLASVLVELKDIASSVALDLERVESDPARLQHLSDRLGTIYSLIQKHRAQNLDHLLELRDKYSSELLSIVEGDQNIASLKREVERHEKESTKLAAAITKKRSELAPLLAAQIVATLQKLGMVDARFEVQVSPLQELTALGADQVEFLFSANRGVAPQPVERIASGGEISRVMLSLKAILAQHRQLPTIIFDEIDTGVSGRIADAMGDIIASLAHSMQVIDITHLPQVASKGDTHFVVYKHEGRTSIIKLTDEQRVEQIATMLSGSEITQAAEEQARILLRKL